jgi:signal transduction histidine kinase
LDAARKQGGLGLVSMDERIKLVGGTFGIHAAPGQGTQIRALVPLAQTEIQPAAGAPAPETGLL